MADRITWLPADITEWTPPAATYDLVTLQFLHLSAAERAIGFRRGAEAVTPGGTLLIVGHHPSDMEADVGRWPVPDRFFTAEQVAEDLGDGWHVVAAEARPRQVEVGGRPATIHDTVLVAQRR